MLLGIPVESCSRFVHAQYVAGEPATGHTRVRVDNDLDAQVILLAPVWDNDPGSRLEGFDGDVVQANELGDMAEATDRAREMVASNEYRLLRSRIETALFRSPTLNREELERCRTS